MNEHFYLGLANEMVAKLRRVASFVSHRPSIGAYHEEVLRTILGSMLPSRFQLRTGFAFSPEHGASQQGDILIIDENHPNAYYFREGNFVVAAPEAIVCVIEVKTKLNKTAFVDAISNLHSFGTVATSAAPRTFLFSFESQPFKQQTLGCWYDSIVDVPDELKNYPWAIYALNQGMIMLRRPIENAWGHVVIEGESGRSPKVQSLSLFLQTIRKTLLLHSQVDCNPFKNALFDGLRYGDYLCRFGPHAAAA